MRDLAILTFLSLDGVMQGVGSPKEDTSGHFTRGGWATPYWDDAMAQVQQEAMSEPYDLLFGRKTYEMFAANQPTADDAGPVARMMADATKYVVSSALTHPGWPNTTVLRGDVASEVKRLKEQEGPLLQVHGSWQLIQALLAHGLVDEFRLWTFPVIVGSGKRLFAQNAIPKSLKLIRSSPCPNGVMMTIYRPATAPKQV